MFWLLFTRLGEAQILLPALLVGAAWLATAGRAPRLAAAWLAATALAAGATTASKVAFLGFGWGLAALDFTGFSGHAMFAAAIWPLLLGLAVAASWPGAQPVRAGRWALAAGAALALGVAVSRVAVQAHSWSEVIAGAALGAAAGVLALHVGGGSAVLGTRAPGQAPSWLWRGLPALVLGWAVLGVAQAPPSRTHDWVTRLALASSGRVQPFHRSALHQRPRAAGAPVLR